MRTSAWASLAVLAHPSAGLVVPTTPSLRPLDGRVAAGSCRMGIDPETRIWTPDDITWTPSEKTGARDEAFGPLTGKYCEDLNEVFRRKTRTVTAGPVKFGSEHPIVRQTMGTTSTKDVKGTVDQIMRCADVGFDLVRITVVGMKEANACHEIRAKLDQKGYDIPLCADMHFQPKVAIKTAEAVEKIRINPGNFADGRKVDEDTVVYETEEDFLRDREYIVEAFAPLVETWVHLRREFQQLGGHFQFVKFPGHQGVYAMAGADACADDACADACADDACATPGALGSDGARTRSVALCLAVAALRVLE